MAAHADYLLRNCWKAQLTISLPRLRPCAGEFQPLTHMSDRDLAQLVCAFRLMFPDVGLVLSTREPAKLRDGLIPLGVTMMSAGSHTEPGGYTGAGREKLHQTVRGRIVELASGASEWAPRRNHATNATGQFQIADERSPRRSGGLDPPARLRAGLEGLGRGADGVKRNIDRTPNTERRMADGWKLRCSAFDVGCSMLKNGRYHRQRKARRSEAAVFA